MTLEIKMLKIALILKLFMNLYFARFEHFGLFILWFLSYPALFSPDFDYDQLVSSLVISGILPVEAGFLHIHNIYCISYFDMKVTLATWHLVLF